MRQYWSWRSTLQAVCSAFSLGIAGCTANPAENSSPTGNPHTSTPTPTVTVSPTAHEPKESASPDNEQVTDNQTVTLGSIEHPWTMYAYDTRNSAHTSASGPDGPIGEAWSVGGAKAVYTTPAVTAERVYFGASDNRVYAVDTPTGEIGWTFETGYYVVSSPAIVDETVYFGSGDRNVYAVEASTGEERWRAETTAKIDPAVTVSDGIVVAAGRRGEGTGYVFGLDAATGSELWTREVDSWVTNAPAIVDGTAYVASRRGTVYALELSSGEVHWNVTGPSQEASHLTAPTVVDGTVYVLMRDSEQEPGSRVYAIGKDSGDIRWTTPVAGPNLPDTLAVADGRVYTVSATSRPCEGKSEMPCIVPISVVTALNVDNGSIEWQKRWERDPDTGPTLDAGSLYFVASGRIMALDKGTGAEKWNYDLPEFAMRPPAVSNGALFIGNADGTVRALGQA